MTPVSYLETGVLYCGDNVERLSQFPAESVDLIYLDPPFFSNRNYEVIWGDEAEVRSFEDRWEGGIQVYVNWMRERMIELHRVLKPTGTLYLHCDWHASHYLKVMCDDIFGRTHFLNEIVWRYRRWPSKQANFQRMHDVILRYGKAGPVTWNQPYEALSAETMKRIPGGKKIVTTLDKHGKKRIRATEEDSKGVPMSDVWEIPQIVGPTAERLGYPTQKPEKLLERIILASSNRGDIVLDPFCGCGTTLVAAHRHGRAWIGIDISPTAVGLMKWRLEKMGALPPKLVGMPVTEEQLHALKPFEFQNWVIQQMHGSHAPRKVGDMGVDGYSFMLHEPIQVKQSEHVGRPVIDAFQTAVERSGKAKGYVVAFSFTKGAYEESARVKTQRGLDIILLPVSAILGGTDIVTPEPGLFMPELPLPEPRKPESRPSVEDLIASEHGAAGHAMAAEEPADY